jgi:hypothetical protein
MKLSDVRIWTMVFFALRLVGITNPPLEAGHSWRQSLTCMVARNFVSDGPDLLHPRIDMAGDLTGIIGSEFPFFNLLIWAVASLFGYEHWYGRLINLVVSSIGGLYFYGLVERLLGHRVAFNAFMALSVSIFFSFSRKIMPDVFSMSLMMTGIYLGHRYWTDGRWYRLALCFVAISLALLSKIPSATLLAAAPLLLLRYREQPGRTAHLMVALAVAVLLASLWYFTWVPHLIDTYGYRLYFPKTLIEGMLEIAPHWLKVLDRFEFSALESHAAFLCFVLGLVFMVKLRNRLLLVAFGLVSAVFLFFTLKTGAVFPLHNYYIIPYVPMMALLAGYGISHLPQRWGVVLLLVVSVEAIANQHQDFFIKPNERYRLSLEEIVEKHIPKGDLIIINGGPSPMDIYYADRKGWSIDRHAEVSGEQISELRRRGARFLIINRHYDAAVRSEKMTVVHQTADYSIIRL